MPTLEEELKEMEEGIRRLKIEYHIFFNGNRKKPPEDLRLRLERLAKQLSERSNMTHAQRFRYTTLLTRYYAYRNLWRRIMQEREKGREAKTEIRFEPVQSPGGNLSGEKFRVSLSDPKTEEEKVKSLYKALLRLKTENSQKSAVSYPQFSKYIASQTHNLRSKFGCVRVAYIITLEGDDVRFTAVAENS
jgi:hypothetical protein